MLLCIAVVLPFFFQAEDGIRDSSVTGVQTCALPICGPATRRRLALPEAAGDRVHPLGELGDRAPGRGRGGAVRGREGRRARRGGARIGEKAAEELKIAIGSAFPGGKARAAIVTGRELDSGAPREVRVTDDEVRQAISEAVR